MDMKNCYICGKFIKEHEDKLCDICEEHMCYECQNFWKTINMTCLHCLYEIENYKFDVSIYNEEPYISIIEGNIDIITTNNINKILEYGDTYFTLYYKIHYNNYENIEKLISKGADVNVKNNQLLYISAESNKIELCKKLLDAGADRIEIKNNYSNKIKELLMTY